VVAAPEEERRFQAVRVVEQRYLIDPTQPNRTPSRMMRGVSRPRAGKAGGDFNFLTASDNASLIIRFLNTFTEIAGRAAGRGPSRTGAGGSVVAAAILQRLINIARREWLAIWIRLEPHHLE
jgi:hypothetical protein